AVGAQLLFQSLDNQAVASIVSVYESFGFPKIKLVPQLDEQLAQEIQENVAQHHAKAREDLQKQLKLNNRLTKNIVRGCSTNIRS
ncbi:hypothetical protein Pfo_031637, partial [Paulownia fortunei]